MVAGPAGFGCVNGILFFGRTSRKDTGERTGRAVEKSTRATAAYVRREHDPVLPLFRSQTRDLVRDHGVDGGDFTRDGPRADIGASNSPNHADPVRRRLAG